MTDIWKQLGESLEDVVIDKGGPGSGHHGHAGRPGMVGGGQAGEGGGKPPPVLEDGLPKRTAQTSRIVDMQRGAKSEDQRKTSELGGGIGNSYKSDIKDDGRVCYKPDQENGYYYAYNQYGEGKLLPLGKKFDEFGDPGQRLRNELATDIPMSLREQAVNKIDREMGFNVTPDSIVGDFGKGKGSALAWVDGEFNVGQQDFILKDMKNPDCMKIAALDFVCGNTDRHMGNIIRGTDGRIYAPDNGLSFPNVSRPRGFRCEPLRMIARDAGLAIPREIKDGVARLTDDKLAKYMRGFSSKEIEGVKYRRDALLRSRTFAELKNRAAEWRY